MLSDVHSNHYIYAIENTMSLAIASSNEQYMSNTTKQWGLPFHILELHNSFYDPRSGPGV